MTTIVQTAPDLATVKHNQQRAWASGDSTSSYAMLFFWNAISVGSA